MVINLEFLCFDNDRETIDNYLQKYRLPREVRDLKSEKKVALFLTSTTLDMYTKLKETVRPKPISQISYEEVEQILLTT